MKIRIAVLIPICLAMMLTLIASIFHIYLQQIWCIESEIKSHIEEVEDHFYEKQNENARMLTIILDIIKDDEKLQKYWITKDKDASVSNAKPIYKNPLIKYRIEFGSKEILTFRIVYLWKIEGKFVCSIELNEDIKLERS